jgi:hypothetical protein
MESKAIVVAILAILICKAVVPNFTQVPVITQVPVNFTQVSVITQYIISNELNTVEIRECTTKIIGALKIKVKNWYDLW